MKDTYTKNELVELFRKKKTEYEGNKDVPAIYLIAEIENELSLN